MAMGPPELDPEDQTQLDELFEAVLLKLADGAPIDIDALLAGRSHLRSQAQRLVELAREIAAAEAPRMPAKPVPVAGYSILEELGRGGMGIVYKARQEALGRTVALKVLPPALLMSSSSRERFVREAQTLARIHHHNVIAIYDVVASEHVFAYAMEWIEGEDLGQAIARSSLGPDPSVVARIGAAVASALESVHALGLVHRDIKPSNILLRKDGTPVLTDFSLVRDSELSSHTATGLFLGTLAFAAPEQLRGEHANVGPWSDIFSLGATLHVALTGRTPFGSTSTAEVLRRATLGIRTPLRRVNPGVPRDFETIVAKTLESDPTRRYATANELAADLERLLRKEPIHARPVGAFGRMQRWMERRPLFAFAMIGLVALLSVGLAITLNLAWTLAQNRADLEGALARERGLLRNAETLRASAEAAEAAAKADRQAQAEAFDFVRWVIRFGDASHGVGGNAKLTAHEALDRAVAQLENRTLKYEPATELAIRLQVSETYLSIGSVKSAAPLLEKALPLAHSAFGARSRQVAEAAHLLGRCQRLMGDLAGAERHLLLAVELRQELPGVEAQYLAQSWNSLGILRKQRGNLRAAEDAYRRALQLYTQAFGPSDENVALVLHSVSVLKLTEGRVKEAEAHAERSLAILRTHHGDKPSLDLANTYFLLGKIRVALDHVSEGTCIMEQAREMTIAVAGKKHRTSASQAESLAAQRRARGDLESAETLLREACATFRDLGIRVDACRTQQALADLLLAAGRARHAEEAALVALTLADDPTSRGLSWLRLGTAHFRQGRFEAAENDLFTAWRQLSEVLPRIPHHQELERTWLALYREWGVPADDHVRAELAAALQHGANPTWVPRQSGP